jgi:hypothetical protein
LPKEKGLAKRKKSLGKKKYRYCQEIEVLLKTNKEGK